MQRFPSQLSFRPSAAVRKAAGPNLDKVARLALQAVLENGQTLEIAHRHFSYGALHFALSSRIGQRGQLILDVDLGTPALAGRTILEDDLRKAERAHGLLSRSGKHPLRPHGPGGSRGPMPRSRP